MPQLNLNRPKIEKLDVKGATINNNKVPKLRQSALAAVKGVKQGLPVPEFEESMLQEKIALALDKIEQADGEEISEEELIGIINYVYDMLDDGKRNYSRAISPRMRRIITIVFSFLPVTVYAIYALTTGDFSLSSIINLF